MQGDYVDVILIQSFDDKITADPRRRTVGETVLHDVRVIAVDQSLTPPAVGVTSRVNTEARIPKTVTLEVSERACGEASGRLETWQVSAFASAPRGRGRGSAGRRTHRQAGLGVGCLVGSRMKSKAAAAQPQHQRHRAAAPQPPPPAPCPPVHRQHTRRIRSMRPSNSVYYRAPADTTRDPSRRGPAAT